MIEDFGGCFHHFSHLLACPQGDGKEISSFSSLEEILMEQYFENKSFLSEKSIRLINKFQIAQRINQNHKTYLSKSQNVFVN